MKDKLKEKLLNTIEKYRMFEKDDIVPIAYSGGKDSATAIILLNELGYNIQPVIVDRGDDSRFNSEKIKDLLYKNTGIEADIINLKDEKFHESISSKASKKIKKYLYKFDHLLEGESHCTPCYNARTTALVEYTKKVGGKAFVIGQHKIDMITSLLKCYWTEQYWLNFTKLKGIPYDGNLMKEFINSNDIDLVYLRQMVEKGRAATDDPPVEKMNGGIKLVRPLCEISEKEIKNFIESIKFPYDSSNCSYRERNPRPFRLLVQFDLERRIKENPELEDILFEFVLMGLNEDGTLKFRPRNKRNEYWPGFKPYIKKL